MKLLRAFLVLPVFSRSFVVLLAMLGVLSTAAPAWAQRKLVMVGGGLEDLDSIIYNGTTPRPPGTGPSPVGAQVHSVAIFQRIVQLAGGAKNIGVLTTASAASDAQANGAYYVDVFRYYNAGAATAWIPVRIDANGNCAVSNSDPALVAQINAMDGFFFGGGDQSRIPICFFNGSGAGRTDSPIMTALRNKFAAGAVVSGTSAGTSILPGIPMAIGGESYYSLRYGIYSTPGTSTTVPTSANNNPLILATSYSDRLAEDSAGGFGLFTEGFVDPHFSERGRQGRLLRLAWNRAIALSFGVDENTALVVENAGSASSAMSVVGQNGVFVFDLSQASSTRVSPGSSSPCSSSASSFKLCYIRTHYLTQGDGYAPATRTFSTSKTRLVGSGSMIRAPKPEDVFSSPDNGNSSSRKNPRAFAAWASSLLRSSATATSQSSYEGTGETRFKVCMQELSDESPAGYVSTVNPAIVGFRNLIVDILPSTTPCP
jgi:cyanophycinase